MHYAQASKNVLGDLVAFLWNLSGNLVQCIQQLQTGEYRFQQL